MSRLPRYILKIVLRLFSLLPIVFRQAPFSLQNSFLEVSLIQLALSCSPFLIRPFWTFNELVFIAKILTQLQNFIFGSSFLINTFIYNVGEVAIFLRLKFPELKKRNCKLFLLGSQDEEVFLHVTVSFSLPTSFSDSLSS